MYFCSNSLNKVRKSQVCFTSVFLFDFVKFIDLLLCLDIGCASRHYIYIYFLFFNLVIEKICRAYTAINFSHWIKCCGHTSCLLGPSAEGSSCPFVIYFSSLIIWSYHDLSTCIWKLTGTI